jgi:hypothetical protein
MIARRPLGTPATWVSNAPQNWSCEQVTHVDQQVQTPPNCGWFRTTSFLPPFHLSSFSSLSDIIFYTLPCLTIYALLLSGKNPIALCVLPLMVIVERTIVCYPIHRTRYAIYYHKVTHRWPPWSPFFSQEVVSFRWVVFDLLPQPSLNLCPTV